jgi:hypothetical protein
MSRDPVPGDPIQDIGQPFHGSTDFGTWEEHNGAEDDRSTMRLALDGIAHRLHRHNIAKGYELRTSVGWLARYVHGVEERDRIPRVADQIAFDAERQNDYFGYVSSHPQTIEENDAAALAASLAPTPAEQAQADLDRRTDAFNTITGQAVDTVRGITDFFRDERAAQVDQYAETDHRHTFTPNHIPRRLPKVDRTIVGAPAAALVAIGGNYVTFADIFEPGPAQFVMPDGSVIESDGMTDEPGDAEYDAFAAQTLDVSRVTMAPDGTMMLANPAMIDHATNAALTPFNAPEDDFYEAVAQTEQQAREARNHVGGVTTLLWKLGFMRLDTTANDGNPRAAEAALNSAAESRSAGHLTRVRLPFDPANPLHQALAIASGSPALTRPMLQLLVRDAEDPAAIATGATPRWPKVSLQLIDGVNP